MFIKNLILFFILLLIPICNAEFIKTDRYTLIQPQPQVQELDPLSVNIQVAFPPHIKTVREAVNFILLQSGWVLAGESSSDGALDITLNRYLPQVHQKLSLMPLRTALQVLVGAQYEPVEDPIRRIYSFDLKDEYRGLVKHD